MKNEIIKTNNYLLVVDDSEIKEGDCINDVYDGIVRVEHKYQLSNIMVFRQDCQKIIAHLPLNDSPVLEGVMILPPLEVDDDVWSLGLKERLDELPYTKHLDDGGYNDGQVGGFEIGAEWGYNKAREKYSLSNIIDLYIKETGCGMDMWSKEENEIMTTIGKIIESLPQPKTPTHFEFEMVRSPNYRDGMLDVDVPYSYYVIKKTTNSQGQEVACGQYLYAS